MKIKYTKMKLKELFFVLFFMQLQWESFQSALKVSRLLDKLLMNYTKSLRPTHNTGEILLFLIFNISAAF
jgi:hypothetical protein